MKRFIHVPSREWQLSGSMAKLASPGYETIVMRLAAEATVVAYRRERAKRQRNSFWANLRLRCKSETILLFHNSRSGYRAQYYSSMHRGEIANQFAVSVLASRIGQLIEGKAKRGCAWPWMRSRCVIRRRKSGSIKATGCARTRAAIGIFSSSDGILDRSPEARSERRRPVGQR
jgi:hypothetical protein